MGLDGWLVKVFWLGKLVLVFWWVELDFFSLECNEVSSICMVCLSLELVGSWVELGFSVGIKALDKLLSINVPSNHGVLTFWI